MNMKTLFILLFCLYRGGLALAAGADAIYLGGDIVTMQGKAPHYVQALAVRDGKIAYAGKLADARKLQGPSTRVVDLQGKTLLPGFIDSHGHMIMFGKNLMDADLFGSKDVADVVARMKAQTARVPEGAWIVGFGYSTKLMAEKRTPTSEELDQVSADRPVMIVDGSGHLGSMNSALMKIAGVSAATPDPEGGAFSRKPGSKELAGPMEETALNAVRFQRPLFSGKLADEVATGGAALWAQYGQTTAQDCGVGLGADDIALVMNAVDKNLLPIDLYVCAKDSATDDVINAAYVVNGQYNGTSAGTASKLLSQRTDLDKRYINRVRLGGIKFWLDGSVDTAWFTKPYAINPPGKSGTYVGYRQIPDEVLNQAFDKFWATNMQINMHMNGDAAADQAINAIELAIKKYGMKDHRPVFIHASYLRPDQISKMKRIGAVPSFLTGSLPVAGDAIIGLWGTERADRSAAARTMIRAGIPFTLSHDAPVTPRPDVMYIVDAAVNHLTSSGKLVAPDERISPYDALRAVTAMAAYQIKEEKSKGTLEKGKLADLVVLEKNPMKVEPTSIKSIRVMETIKEGKTVYLAKP
jgi:predicted amidohydrolase YtcJ